MDNTYVYGKLENGKLEYFIPTNGGLVTRVYKRSRWSTVFYPNPSESIMNENGWYRVVNVEGDGEDYQAGNVIYHYTGISSDYIEVANNEESADE